MNKEQQQFGEVAKMIQPFTTELKVHEVVVDLNSTVLAAYAQALEELFDREAPSLYTSGKSCRGMALEYFKLLIEVRVLQAWGQRIPGVRPTDHQIVVPAFMNALLEQLGEVYSLEYGLHLMPVLQVWSQSPQFFSADEDGEGAVNGVKEYNFKAIREDFDVKRFFELARLVRVWCEQSRVVYAKGLARSSEGNIEMMALQVTNNHVCGESNHSHPIFSLMAAVLSLSIVKCVINPRVMYLDLPFAEHLVQGVTRYEQRTSGKMAV